MCTSIIEIARAEGMAMRGDEWFPLSQAVVAYDHARHAPLGDVITLDFINTDLDPGARAGIELTLETAKGLRAALDRAIAAAEFEEAEVRGKGVVPSLGLACLGQAIDAAFDPHEPAIDVVQQDLRRVGPQSYRPSAAESLYLFGSAARCNRTKSV